MAKNFKNLEKPNILKKTSTIIYAILSKIIKRPSRVTIVVVMPPNYIIFSVIVSGFEFISQKILISTIYIFGLILALFFLIIRHPWWVFSAITSSPRRLGNNTRTLIQFLSTAKNLTLILVPPFKVARSIISSSNCFCRTLQQILSLFLILVSNGLNFLIQLRVHSIKITFPIGSPVLAIICNSIIFVICSLCTFQFLVIF